MQILKRLLYVVLIVPIFFVYGSVSADDYAPKFPCTKCENLAQNKKYDDCVLTRSKTKEPNPTINEACLCIAKGGILLSSDVPGTTNGSIIQGRCVYTNGDTVSVANQIFSMITRIVMIILGITIFGMIVWGGMQFVIFAGSDDGPKKGKAMIKNAIIAGFAVSMIGVVLRFINPNIFK